MPESKANITIFNDGEHVNTKASEEYVHVRFCYPGGIEWDGWIPIKYRRTGIDIDLSDKDGLDSYLKRIYSEMNPENYDAWSNEQKRFWNEEKSKATDTKYLFDSLADGKWHCIKCGIPNNPNWARRNQDLKEMGYTIATDLKKYCPKCKENRTHLMLLPIKRGASDGNGYETFSPTLRSRIIKLLNSYDVYECRVNPHCLPDHKFSEIRWDDNTKTTNPDSMTDDEIRQKFQLLTNQRNQQKREVCRNCFQTGKRGTAFGIKFFYQGTEDWDPAIPPIGKEAERGCIGCPWYDFEEWRKRIIRELED